MKKKTDSRTPARRSSRKPVVQPPLPVDTLRRLVQQFTFDLGGSGCPHQQRLLVNTRLTALLDGQLDRPAGEADPGAIAGVVYQLCFTTAERQNLCHIIQGFFSYCLRRRVIPPALFERVLRHFYIPKCALPAGIMSLDQIRSALRAAPTVHAKLLLVYGLFSDELEFPLQDIKFSFWLPIYRENPATEHIRRAKHSSWASWVKPLRKVLSHDAPAQNDYQEVWKILERLGFESPEKTLRGTHLAYAAALAGPMARFAIGRFYTPRKIERGRVRGLDAWSGHLFHYGLTPESCGIRGWPGSPVPENRPKLRR